MIQECVIDDFTSLKQDEYARQPESAHYRFAAPLTPVEELMAMEEEHAADQTSEQRRDDLLRILRFIVGQRDDRPALICRRVFVLCAQFAPGMLSGPRWSETAREVE